MSESSFSLEAIFRPKSIAVVGASRKPESVGFAVFQNLLGNFKGPLYPVNAKADSILNVRCFPSLASIPGPVDLAVLIVPAPSIPALFSSCAEKGVRGIIVISAGFKETGAEGAALEKKLLLLAQRFAIPFIGPNCLGVINTEPGITMNASFSRSMPQQGRIAFVSQSGALCTAILDYAKGNQFGFSKFISMGNKTCVNEVHLLDYLAKDPQTDLILLYLEDLAAPRELLEVCRRITNDADHAKPVLAIKSGRTTEGARAASSHTGSLAGSDEVVTALFAQAGILRVQSIEELFDYAQAFAARKLPRGNRAAIVTNAGGPGIIATDICVQQGLTMATLSSATIETIRPLLPSTASVRNPVDVIGDARHDRYEAVLDAVWSDPAVDGGVVILTPQAMTDIEETARVIAASAEKTRKPMLACLMGTADIGPGEKILQQRKIPNYRFPESACKALAAMTRYREWIDRPRTEIRRFSVDVETARRYLEEASANRQHAVLEKECVEILTAYGFPALPTQRCKTPREAAGIAEQIGFPVALKISSPDILHKVDVGGVRLNLKTRPEVESAAAEMLRGIGKKMPSAVIAGLTVQKMAAKGREVILGFHRDPLYGPLLMFGLGGTYVEIFKDVTFRLAPIRELGARNMVRSIRAYKILEGFRGEPAADVAKIEECLERLSQLAMEQPLIQELDINPLMVYPQGSGCAVVDARIILA